jgi:hypothetical protein
MKGSKFIYGLLVVGALFFLDYKNADTGIIKGSITPEDAAQHVLAISGNDTLDADVKFGIFQFDNVKVGHYTVIVAARAPYKPYVSNDVVVSDGSFVDLGQITLGE